MFRIGDKIVHPMHGAGIVDQIVTRKVNGVLRDYYSLKLPLGDMLVSCCGTPGGACPQGSGKCSIRPGRS